MIFEENRSNFRKRNRSRPKMNRSSGLSIAETARQMGASQQTSSKWLSRSSAGEGLSVAVERIMIDNGPSYRSGEIDALLESGGIQHRCTRPLSPGRAAISSARTGRLRRNGGTSAPTRARPRWMAPSRPTWSTIIGSACGGPSAHVAHRRCKQPNGAQQLAGHQLVPGNRKAAINCPGLGFAILGDT